MGWERRGVVLGLVGARLGNGEDGISTRRFSSLLSLSFGPISSHSTRCSFVLPLLPSYLQLHLLFYATLTPLRTQTERNQNKKTKHKAILISPPSRTSPGRKEIRVSSECVGADIPKRMFALTSILKLNDKQRSPLSHHLRNRFLGFLLLLLRRNDQDD